MFEIERLEAAGFEKTMTSEEWEKLQARLPKIYSRSTPDSIQAVPGSEVVVDYVLRRGDVIIRTEQNTQDNLESGLRTTIHYPEIVVLEAAEGRVSVSCAADETDLILLLADEIAQAGPGRRGPTREANGRPVQPNATATSQRGRP